MSARRGPRRAGEDRALELALLDVLYAHWARGEFFATQELYDPALEFVFSDDFPEAGVHQGIEGMGAAFVAWLRAWELWRVRADEYRVVPDGRIVVLATFHGRGKGSQADVVSLGANVWTFRDGRVVRLEIHAARRDALALLSLRGPEAAPGA